MEASEIDRIIGLMPDVHRDFLAYCFNGRIIKKIQDLYGRPSSILTIVNDDQIPILGQVSSTATKWNKAVNANNISGSDVIGLPFLYFIGYSDPSKTQEIYSAIEKNFENPRDLRALFSEDDIKDGTLKYILPNREANLDPGSLIVHAQDLRLGQSTTGSRLVGIMDQAKAQGKHPGLHFVLPWSSLATGKVNNPSIDEFRTASQFYVMMAPKEYSEQFESNGPALIRDILKALIGELPIVNASSYRGPLKLY